MTRKFASFIIKWRITILIFVGITTLYFLYSLKDLSFHQSLLDIIPKNHPIIQRERIYLEVFGGNNLISIALRVKEGDIFNLDTLGKIYRITQKLETFAGVVPYRIVSIASRKLRYVYTTIDPASPDFPTMYNTGLFTMVQQIIRDKDLEYLETYKKAITSDPDIMGTFVSRDMKGTVILADFWAEEGFKGILQNLQELLEQEADSNNQFHIGGRPIMLGYLYQYMQRVIYIFALALLVIFFLLLMNFGTLRGIMMAFFAGFITVVWGEISALFGIRMDMMSITVPFMIMAIEVSHAVQILSRYYEEYARWGDNKRACEETIVGLLKPGFSAILTDGLGFTCLFFFHFRLLQSMALIASLGAIRMFITSLITLPCLLATLPPPKPAEIERARRMGIVEKLMEKLSGLTSRPGARKIILAFFVLFLMVGFAGTYKLEVGDLQPGYPFFWSDSKYNQDDLIFRTWFSGTNPCYIIIDTGKWHGLVNIQLAKEVEGLQNFLRKRPEVGYVSSYVDILKKMNMAWHDNDPDWYKLPEKSRLIGEFFHFFIGGVEPEVTKPTFDTDQRYANIQIFLRDHKTPTIKGVMADIQEFLAKNQKTEAEFIYPAGIIGVYSSIIDDIEGQNYKTLLGITIAIFLFATFSFSSWKAGLLIILPLWLGNLFTQGVMGFGEIGLFFYTIPIASMGMGLGVDYYLYFLHRLKEEMNPEKGFEEAKKRAMVTSGKAIFFAASSIIAGVLTLLISSLRFQALMGGMLAIVITCNALGALVLMPALISLWHPKFLTKGTSRA